MPNSIVRLQTVLSHVKSVSSAFPPTDSSHRINKEFRDLSVHICIFSMNDHEANLQRAMTREVKILILV